MERKLPRVADIFYQWPLGTRLSFSTAGYEWHGHSPLDEQHYNMYFSPILDTAEGKITLIFAISHPFLISFC